MAINYDVGTNIITVTAYTEETPCTFLDVYNADVAGGWGVVTRQGDRQYTFAACLKIGDGETETYFADDAVAVLFEEGIASAWSKFCVSGETNSHVRFGKLIDEDNKTTSSGVQIDFSNNTASLGRNGALLNTAPDIKAYSCLFRGNDAAIQNVCVFTGRIWNTICERTLFYRCYLNAYNVYMSRPEAALTCLSYPDGAFNDIQIRNYAYPLYVGMALTEYTTISNVVLKDNTYTARIEGSASSITLINPEVDAWEFLWQGNAGQARIYRDYHLDIKVVDCENNPLTAKVEIWDKDDTKVTDVETDANGDIVTQTLRYGYYAQANGNTPVMKTPHHLKISVPDSDYLTCEGYITIDQKLKEVIHMVDLSDITGAIEDIQTALSTHDTEIKAKQKAIMGLILAK